MSPTITKIGLQKVLVNADVKAKDPTLATKAVMAPYEKKHFIMTAEVGGKEGFKFENYGTFVNNGIIKTVKGSTMKIQEIA